MQSRHGQILVCKLFEVVLIRSPRVKGHPGIKNKSWVLVAFPGLPNAFLNQETPQTLTSGSKSKLLTTIRSLSNQSQHGKYPILIHAFYSPPAVILLLTRGSCLQGSSSFLVAIGLLGSWLRGSMLAIRQRV